MSEVDVYKPLLAAMLTDPGLLALCRWLVRQEPDEGNLVHWRGEAEKPIHEDMPTDTVAIASELAFYKRVKVRASRRLSRLVKWKMVERFDADKEPIIAAGGRTSYIWVNPWLRDHVKLIGG